MKVNGKDDLPYMKWKIIQMFETTNQCSLMRKKRLRNQQGPLDFFWEIPFLDKPMISMIVTTGSVRPARTVSFKETPNGTTLNQSSTNNSNLSTISQLYLHLLMVKIPIMVNPYLNDDSTPPKNHGETVKPLWKIPMNDDSTPMKNHG